MMKKKYYIPNNETPIYMVNSNCKQVDVFEDIEHTQKAEKCQLPAELTVNITDCWDHMLEPYKNAPHNVKFGEVFANQDEIDKILSKQMNPCTGPIYFEGVKAGDILKIDINEIACTTGSIMTINFEGVCGKLVRERVVKFYEIKDGNKLVLDEGYEAEICPMIGVIGVLPKDGEFATCVPGNWGGNMDTTLIKKGASLYIPVQVDGGMLYLGDAHAQMGEGEQYTTGLEADAIVNFNIEVIKEEDKKDRYLNIDTPFVKADNRLACICTAGGANMAEAMIEIAKDSGKENISFLKDEITSFVESVKSKLKDNAKAEKVETGLKELLENFIDDPLRGVTDDALRLAMNTFIEYLVNNSVKKSFTPNEAGILCGLFGDLAVSQIADDPYRTARLSMETRLLKEYLGIDV